MAFSERYTQLPDDALKHLDDIFDKRLIHQSLDALNNTSSSFLNNSGGPARQKRSREPSDEDHNEPANKRGASKEGIAFAVGPEEFDKIRSFLQEEPKEDNSLIKILQDRMDFVGDAEGGENDYLTRQVRYLSLSPNSITTTLEDVFAPDAASILEAATASLTDRSATSCGILSREPLPGILLYGPPGTGKTLLGKAIAKKSNATLLTLSGAELRSGIRGSSEKIIKNVFAYARKHHPCIVFIDNAHTVLADDKGSVTRDNHDVIGQLLVEMTGINSRGRMDPIVIATTSQPYDLNEPILRCFSIRIMVGLPGASARQRILDIQLRGEKIGCDVNLEDLAKETKGYSGRDIRDLVLNAAIAAQGYRTNGSPRELRSEHIKKAKGTITPSVKPTMSNIMDFHAKYGGMRSAHVKVPNAKDVWTS